MTVKGSHSISYSGTFKPRKLVQTLSPYVIVLVFIYVSSYTDKKSNSISLSLQF